MINRSFLELRHTQSRRGFKIFYEPFFYPSNVEIKTRDKRLFSSQIPHAIFKQIALPSQDPAAASTKLFSPTAFERGCYQYKLTILTQLFEDF